MNRYSIIALIVLVSCSLTFCAMRQEPKTDFPQEIEIVFYQKEKVEKRRGGIYLYVEFKKPLLKSIALNRIYFRNQEGAVKEITPKQFRAYFTASHIGEDFIMDRDPVKEYGNKAPTISNAKFDMQYNEAVLEYTKDRKTYFFKMTDIIEKPLR